MHTPMINLKNDVFSMLTDSITAVKSRPFIFLARPILAGTAGVLLLFPYDASIAKHFNECRSAGTYGFMKCVSLYGNFLGVMSVCIAVWGWGLMRNRRSLVLAGTAALLAASLAGLFDNVIRVSTGRPRPKTMIEHEVRDSFYGPSLDSRYQSFPSAHCAVALGAAIAISVCVPPLALPVLAGALLVAFSRMYLLAHYPSDVFMGCVIGIWFGLVIGIESRRISP